MVFEVCKEPVLTLVQLKAITALAGKLHGSEGRNSMRTQKESRRLNGVGNEAKVAKLRALSDVQLWVMML